MTPVVIDASAGVELAADTRRGRDMWKLLPSDAVPWVPDHFYVECGAVLRRWDLNRVLTPEQIGSAVEELRVWPLRAIQLRGLFPDAWALRETVTWQTPSTWHSLNILTPQFSPTTPSWPTRPGSLSASCTCR